MFKRLLSCLALAAACALSLPAQNVPGDGSGLWFTPKNAELTFQGLAAGDAIVFTRPVNNLPAGSYVQFGVNLEAKGPKAPGEFTVEIQDGTEWVSGGGFVTIDPAARHPSCFLHIFRLNNPVSDTLRVRCRVSGDKAIDGGLLSKDAPDNKFALKTKSYVGAYLNPIGSHVPVETKSLLLIGNSFTYYYGEAFMLQEIAFSQGLQLNIDMSLKGGQTFRQQCGLQMTGIKIAGGPYDCAIVQGQSQEPAKWAKEPGKHKDVKKAFQELCKSIRKSSPYCHIYMENTWSYPGASNGGFDSEQEFNELLIAGTKRISRAGRADVSPVGEAFTLSRKLYPNINLFSSDNKHQSQAGSYLKACVGYLLLRGLPFGPEVPSCGLPQADAAALRSVAEHVVLRTE